MRVLLDEQLPRQLVPHLVGHDVRTVQQESWAGFKNGALLTQAETARFSVFLTGDQNLDAMGDVLVWIAKAGPTGATVLITGETGVGKDLVATAIHRSSPRRARPLVTLNCASIPEPLLQSELFGHRKGAFTGATSDQPGLVARANGGTLFLDEIGDLPLALQAHLLRFLETGEAHRLGDSSTTRFDVRVVAATSRTGR